MSNFLYHIQKELTSQSLFNNRTNSIVKFNKEGELIKGESFFVDLEMNKDTLIIDFVGFYDASIRILFKENFIEESFFREVIVETKVPSQIMVHIDASDYIDDRLNIEIQSFGVARISDNPLIKYMPPVRKYYIQLDKGERPIKYNIKPIY